MAEFDIQGIVGDLRAAYNATDLTVRATSDRREYIQFKATAVRPELLHGMEISDDVTGMFFMPAANTVDNQHHIGVHLPSFDPSMYMDELTHEFSNYGAWRRWGDQLKQYQEKADKYQIALTEDYRARVSRQANQPEQQLLRSQTHPAQRILEARTIFGFALYDAVVSVPTDYITVEKGFEDRLIRRKKAKMQSWLRDVSPDDASRIWISGNFPYLAYNLFHPNNPRVEKELDSSVREILQVVGYTSMLSPIRRIRELLHTIKTPVEGTNLARTNIAAEKIYYSFQTERSADHTARRYWNMLKDSATAATKAIY